MKRTIIIILAVLLIVQAVNAGVTNPLPSEIELLKGESARFKFQIQAIADPETVICSMSLDDSTNLIISFDEDEVLVEGGTIKEVYGTVTAPRGLTYGNYSGSFCISCDRTEGAPGVSVKINTCDLPINVAVVKQRTRQNMNIPEKPFPILLAAFIAAIAVIVLLLMIILLLILKRKKDKKEEQEKPHKHKKSRAKK